MEQVLFACLRLVTKDIGVGLLNDPMLFIVNIGAFYDAESLFLECCQDQLLIANLLGEFLH